MNNEIESNGKKLDVKCTLPDKPSDLLELALHDLELCEKDNRYEINMHYWHHPNNTGACDVCLSGAVLAKSLGACPTLDIIPEEYSDAEAKLYALHFIRCGWIKSFLATLHCVMPLSIDPTVAVPEYDDDPGGFKRAMRQIITKLRKRGL